MRIPIIALLVTGCAAAAPALPELTPWQPPTGQSCGTYGGEFAAGEIVDSAAFADAFAAVGPADGGLLLRVRVDSAGEEEWFRRIETTLPPADADRIEGALAPLVRRPARGSSSGRLHLQSEDGRMARLVAGPSQSCPPAIRNRWEVQAALRKVHQEQRQTGAAVVRLHVDTAGRVTDAHVHRGSGDVLLDAAILAAGRQANFHPALLDRMPVPVWAEITLTVEVACPQADTLLWRLPADDPCRTPRP